MNDPDETPPIIHHVEAEHDIHTGAVVYRAAVKYLGRGRAYAATGPTYGRALGNAIQKLQEGS